MSNEIIANKTVIKRGDVAAPANFVTWPGVFNIEPPKTTRTKIPVHDLTDDDIRIKLGIRDNGEVTVQYHWIDGDAQQDDAKADYDARRRRYYQLSYPDTDGNPGAGGTDTFAGYVMSLSREPVVIDGKLTRTAVIAIDGAITEA